MQDLAAEIERRAAAKQDFIAPTERMEMVVVEDKPALALANGTVKTFGVNEIAHGQIAEFASIPMAYYRRMMTEDPALLATNVNRWLKDMGGKRRMVRTLDGNVRAVLSDSYRSLENEDLAEAILPQLLEMDLLILSCEITERRLYIKAVDKSIERQLPTGRFMGDGAGHEFFDILSPAISFSNSEVGGGALSIETGVYTRACTNLALTGSNMRKYHTGKRAELSDDVYAILTDDTKRQTDKAVWMQTRDLVKSAFDAAKFEATMLKLGKATKDQMEPTKVADIIEVVGKRFSLDQGERKGILGHLIKGGDLSRYGLHSAVTRFSQDDGVGYDRATELERIGGDIIDMETGALVAA